jgi:hypothetical protein
VKQWRIGIIYELILMLTRIFYFFAAFCEVVLSSKISSPQASAYPLRNPHYQFLSAFITISLVNFAVLYLRKEARRAFPNDHHKVFLLLLSS